MMNFLRSLFGLDDFADTRTVMGNNGRGDVKEGAYIRNSTKRLTILFNLCNRYKDTPHTAKMQAVYEQTKNIHAYLIARKRVTELELFHVQHTDHFINTFTVILDVHQNHQKVTVPAAYPEATVMRERINTEKILRKEPVDVRRQVPKPLHRPGPLVYPEINGSRIARLVVPDIWINPAARILYEKQQTPTGIVTKEISFTSSKQEHENFVLFVSNRLGMRDIVYVGNAMVHIPGNGANATGIVPVLYWQGFNYALNLNDNCLFPVRVNR